MSKPTCRIGKVTLKEGRELSGVWGHRLVKEGSDVPWLKATFQRVALRVWVRKPSGWAPSWYRGDTL